MGCEHDWEFVKGWKNKLDFDGDTLYIPVKCSLCKATGVESFEYTGDEEDR
jgi:hypothetical protein